MTKIFICIIPQPLCQVGVFQGRVGVAEWSITASAFSLEMGVKILRLRLADLLKCVWIILNILNLNASKYEFNPFMSSKTRRRKV